MLYFAYGSNLDWTQMRSRCPSARFVAIAKLTDHCLGFSRRFKDRACGVADVISQRKTDVWGVVYEIDERDVAFLDKSEGFVPGRPATQNAYTREQRHVYADGAEERPLSVSVYVATREKQPPRPNEDYKRLIVEGAKFWHLPEGYIAGLQRIETAS